MKITWLFELSFAFYPFSPRADLFRYRLAILHTENAMLISQKCNLKLVKSFKYGILSIKNGKHILLIEEICLEEAYRRLLLLSEIGSINICDGYSVFLHDPNIFPLDKITQMSI